VVKDKAEPADWGLFVAEITNAAQPLFAIGGQELVCQLILLRNYAQPHEDCNVLVHLCGHILQLTYRLEQHPRCRINNCKLPRSGIFSLSLHKLRPHFYQRASPPCSCRLIAIVANYAAR
jgi:hypothetical protein